MNEVEDYNPTRKQEAQGSQGFQGRLLADLPARHKESDENVEMIADKADA